MSSSTTFLTFIVFGVFYLCAVEASVLWMLKRDKAADVAATLAAVKATIEIATEDELRRLSSDLKKCLASPDQTLIKSVPVEAAKEFLLQEFVSARDMERRRYRDTRSYYDYLYKRGRDEDIEDIMVSSQKLASELSMEDLKTMEVFNQKLDSAKPEEQRKFLDIFIRLADRCAKQRRAFQLHFDDDQEVYGLKK